MNKILFTNLVYGRLYADIFLTQHLRSFLDPTNIPANKENCEYLVFTDQETYEYIKGHPVMIALADTIPVSYNLFTWPDTAPENKKFNARYQLLIETFHHGVKAALDKKMFCSPMVADLVIAKHYVSQLFSRFRSGFDAVFVLPARTALEPMRNALADVDYALDSKALWDLAYKNLHPLWVACHYDSPQFTRLPYSLIWNTGTGLYVRSFSITPIAFVPREEMLDAKQVIDVEVPALVKNPYWALNWTDCPVIGVEPLFCYYPPWGNKPAHPKTIKEWAKRGTHPSQGRWLIKELCYPDRTTTKPERDLIVRSNMAVISILGEENQLESDKSSTVGV